MQINLQAGIVVFTIRIKGLYTLGVKSNLLTVCFYLMMVKRKHKFIY